jgi:hypothetical protein
MAMTIVLPIARKAGTSMRQADHDQDGLKDNLDKRNSFSNLCLFPAWRRRTPILSIRPQEDVPDSGKVDPVRLRVRLGLMAKMPVRDIRREPQRSRTKRPNTSLKSRAQGINMNLVLVMARLPAKPKI